MMHLLAEDHDSDAQHDSGSRTLESDMCRVLLWYNHCTSNGKSTTELRVTAQGAILDNICVLLALSRQARLVSQSFVGRLVAMCIILDNVLRMVLAYSNDQRLRCNNLRQYFVIQDNAALSLSKTMLLIQMVQTGHLDLPLARLPLAAPITRKAGMHETLRCA